MKLLNNDQRRELIVQLGPTAERRVYEARRLIDDARDHQKRQARGVQNASYALARKVQSPKAAWYLRNAVAKDAHAGVFAEPTERAACLEAAARRLAEMLDEPEAWGVLHWRVDLRRLWRRAEKAADTARLAWHDEVDM